MAHWLHETTAETTAVTLAVAPAGAPAGDAWLAPALRGLGLCALGAALTTLVNTVLPNFYRAEDFDGRAALIHDPYYAARQWVLLVHPGFTLLAAIGTALALRRRAPGRAASGLAFASVEKMTEFLLGVSILFVVNGVWKAGYLAQRGTPAAALLRARIDGFTDLLGGAYFLLWAMFILSTGLFASAIDRRDRISRGVVLTGGVTIALTVCLILGRYAGQQAWTGPLITWTYPPALTLHRALVGLWLMREGRRLLPPASPVRRAA